MSYVPIYTNSAYTLMNSTVKINDYITLAKKMGYQMLGLIDEDTLSAALTFYQACLKNEIQPVIGLKFYYQSQTLKKELPIIAIALNYEGFQTLMQVSTKRKCEEKIELATLSNQQNLAWIINAEHPISKEEIDDAIRNSLIQ